MRLRCDANRVLLVDDEPSIRRLFRIILSSELPGCSVEVAENGREAVAAFGRDHHAVLLMDLHMPQMDGRRAFAEIERLCDDRNWEMPAVLFCTGYAPPDSVLGVVKSNPDHGLLLKPVNSEDLVQEVRRRLDTRRAGAGAGGGSQ
jgi:CheY-like chemotaxis protein